MSTYHAPLADMRFVINELAGLPEINRLPGFEEATPDLVESVLGEAARLAGEVLAPLNKAGDLEGARLENGRVVTTPGFAEAYRQFVQGGWLGLGLSRDYDGQGLPHLIATAVNEMWNAANLSFSLCPLLTTGAVEALEAHASAALKQRFLRRLVSGEWTATMNLTEPQAGSDLAAVRTRAEPEGDHHRIRGQKIFITWGDHEMTDNIVHLVLARLPDAPPGVKGISLFAVPKYLVNDDGSLGARNDVHPVSLEHKLGIHASPTCVMSYGDKGGAIGYLVGEAHNGLACMFTMMNHARLGTGLQGVAIAERAYQQAVGYARERIQGSLPGTPGRVAIIQHADVRRMLMLMRALTEATRAVAYLTAGVLDFAYHGADADTRRRSLTRLELLTPIAKGWCSEVGQEVTSLGVQVHGGMGFIEETGAAQHFRDARIITIYEGTTGIQANDLVGRKILRDGGAAMRALLDDIAATGNELEAAGERFASTTRALDEGRTLLADATAWLVKHGPADYHLPGAAAVNLMMLMGTVVGGWQMARAARAAARGLADGAADPDYLNAKLTTVRFYFSHVMPRASGYYGAATAGAADVMALDEAHF
jgi:alkylation response protein AidB-like acyl-CoA dehydrogenase